MDKAQSEIDDVFFEKREFAHKLAAQIEQIGLTDLQRGLLLIDLSRGFENIDLATNIFMLLKEQLDETVRLGQDDDNQHD